MVIRYHVMVSRWLMMWFLIIRYIEVVDVVIRYHVMVSHWLMMWFFITMAVI